MIRRQDRDQAIGSKAGVGLEVQIVSGKSFLCGSPVGEHINILSRESDAVDMVFAAVYEMGRVNVSAAGRELGQERLSVEFAADEIVAARSGECLICSNVVDI